MGDKRMFEYVEGSASKFWEIWADGAGNVLTRFGKLGAAGQTKIKEVGDGARVKVMIDEMVSEKTGKGYVETTAGGKKPKTAPAPADEDDDEDDDEDEDEDDDDDEIPAGVRRFEQATKFWEIELEGASHTVRFGKLGTAGQEKSKSFANEAAAARDYKKLVAEKTGKGYEEVDAGTSTAPALDPKELKRHLGNLSDDAAYLVFADWLQTQNHPWGELIVLQHSAATNPKKAASLNKEADKLLAKAGAAVLGPFARAKYSHFAWRLGFLQRAVIGVDAEPKAIAAGVKALLALPAAARLEQLVINAYRAQFPVWRDWGSSEEHIVDPWDDLEKLAKAIPERIAHVGFGGWPAPAATGYVRMPSFAKLSKAFPKLARLELTGSLGDKPGKLTMSQLVDLEVRFANADGAALAALATAKVPKLQRLSVWLGGSSNVCVDDVYPPAEWEEDQESADRYPSTFSASDLEQMSDYGVASDVSADELTQFLRTTLSPSLVHLGIQSAILDEALVAAIAKSSLVKQLKTLDLSGGTLTDDAAKSLISAKKALAHLESIDVSRNRLTAAGAKKLVAALPNTKVGAIEDKGAEPDFHFRYVATVE